MTEHLSTRGRDLSSVSLPACSHFGFGREAVDNEPCTESYVTGHDGNMGYRIVHRRPAARAGRSEKSVRPIPDFRVEACAFCTDFAGNSDRL